ncbi:MAG: VOC family protein [Methylocystis sp.]|uniref:VOC family protein n=1 Tax=Methylocystis sp. TaxID=1911079 RepID=UPI003D0B6B99
MPVTRLLNVSLTVEHLPQAAAYFRDSLGFEAGPERTLDDPAHRRLLGLRPETTARACDMRVGAQTLEIVAFDPPGAPYPAERAANDQWFQHVALVCRAIEMAAQPLLSGGADRVSRGGPVLLPPSTGSVTAFKFRDPEGHPLELIEFPDGVGATIWRERTGSGVIGYDHTAISTLDLDRSLAFYVGLLGLRVGGRTLNRGETQDRLDGLDGVEVDVVALEPASVATPHVELLHYRAPRGRALAAPLCAQDAASVRQVHEVDDLDALVARLGAAGAHFVSERVVALADGRRAACVRDPDGHMLILMSKDAAA